MPVADINGTQINYIQLECGQRDQPCRNLVMVHGLATSLAFWYIHAQKFSEQYRVTLYDLRGHGRSASPESGYTPGNMVQDLKALLTHLGIERAHFMAHSFGGTVALNLAKLDPSLISSLMLIDTHIHAVRQSSWNHWDFGKKIQPIFEQHGIEFDINDPYIGYKMLYRLAKRQVSGAKIPAEIRELMGPFLGKNSKRTAIRWITLMETTQAEKELMGDDGLSLTDLKKMDFSILVMYGQHSQAMPTGMFLRDVWQQADFKNIRAAGHFFPLTHAEEFTETCKKFLARAMVTRLSPICDIA